MSALTAILVFPGVEELDFVGPYEVFAMSDTVGRMREPDWRARPVRLVAETRDPVTCAKGMVVLPHMTLDDLDGEAVDVFLMPGGEGTKAIATNPALCARIAALSKRAEWTASVCTGARALLAAGPARGRRITTHWRAVEELRATGLAAEVLDDARWVADGNLVTAAGVSAGIDMALWLTGQLHSPAHARAVQRAIEYDPAPPYQD
ncbi:DJ-1/PfpI family protein [Glycocaulis profundi]|nr:DJ-1/PfpI family protein [Glycocaulis profundi]